MQEGAPKGGPLRRPEEINSAIRERAAEGRTLRISGLRGQDRIAVGIEKPLKLLLEGEAGDYTGAMNTSLDITIKGRCGRYLGWGMKGGEIEVYGDVGDEAAMKMEGGKMVIHGTVEGSVASYMRGGVVVVDGDVRGDVALFSTGGVVMVGGEVRGEALPRGARVLLNPDTLPLMRRERMRRLTPQEVRELRGILGEEHSKDLDNMVVVPPPPPTSLTESAEVLPTPFDGESSLSRLSLTINPFSQVKSPDGVYIKSRLGEGDEPLVLPLPLFIPAHTYLPLNGEARRAVLVFSIKSKIPIFIQSDFLDKEVLDALETLTYFLVLTPEEALPQGEVLKRASGVVLDLTRRLVGDTSPYGEIKDPKDMVKFVKLLHDFTPMVLVQIPSSSVFRLTGLSLLSGVDGVVLTTGTAPVGYRNSYVKVPNTIGDLETLSEVHLALEELRPRGLTATVLLDGGVGGVMDVLKALSMGARAVSISKLLLTWLGCRKCTRCDATACPVSILKGSGRPPWGWDEMAETLLERLSEFERSLRRSLVEVGFRGLQELSRRNLTAMDREAAIISSIPLAGLGRRVEGE